MEHDGSFTFRLPIALRRQIEQDAKQYWSDRSTFVRYLIELGYKGLPNGRMSVEKIRGILAERRFSE